MSANPTPKTQAFMRVRPIKGQLTSLEQALAKGADCALVLQRLAVIRGALNGLMLSILGHYLQEQFPAEPLNQNVQAKTLEEKIALMRSYLR